MKARYWFLATVAILQTLLLVFIPEKGLGSLQIFLQSAIRIFPALVFVFILMILLSKIRMPKLEGKRGWLYAIGAGVLSMGPIYAWYPLLSKIEAAKGKIAAFLYSKAIKPALIPIMIAYFGIKFTIAFTVMILIGAVVQGIVINTMERN